MHSIIRTRREQVVAAVRRMSASLSSIRTKGSVCIAAIRQTIQNWAARLGLEGARRVLHEDRLIAVLRVAAKPPRLASAVSMEAIRQSLGNVRRIDRRTSSVGRQKRACGIHAVRLGSLAESAWTEPQMRQRRRSSLRRLFLSRIRPPRIPVPRISSQWPLLLLAGCGGVCALL